VQPALGRSRLGAPISAFEALLSCRETPTPISRASHASASFISAAHFLRPWGCLRIATSLNGGLKERRAWSRDGTRVAPRDCAQ